LFPAISGNSRFVAFEHNAQIYVHNRKNGRTHLISLNSRRTPGDRNSFQPSLSANGRIVAFESFASNLAPHDTNHHADVFIRDRKARRTKRISVSSTGRQGNADSEVDSIPASVVSANGRLIAFDSAASTLVRHDTNHVYDVFVHDRLTQETRRVSVGASHRQGNGSSFVPSLSADGRFVAFTSGASNLVRRDRDGDNDVYVRGPLR
jgi:Tol biopolymer transport system component